MTFTEFVFVPIYSARFFRLGANDSGISWYPTLLLCLVSLFVQDLQFGIQLYFYIAVFSCRIMRLTG